MYVVESRDTKRRIRFESLQDIKADIESKKGTVCLEDHAFLRKPNRHLKSLGEVAQIIAHLMA